MANTWQKILGKISVVVSFLKSVCITLFFNSAPQNPNEKELVYYRKQIAYWTAFFLFGALFFLFFLMGGG
jgi:hypothetical protein